MDGFQYNSGVSPIRKLRLALLVLVILIAGGTFGFVVIEKMHPLNALYMTIITISTVGFGEVAPLHATGKVFAISLITISVLVAGSIITFIGQMTIEGQFKELVVRRKMENQRSPIL